MRCLDVTSCADPRATICPQMTATTGSDCVLDARPLQPCGQSTASGGQGTTKTRHALGRYAGTVSITYDMFSVPDRLDCFYRGVLVATTGGLVSGPGTLTWDYAPGSTDPPWCLVVMSAPNAGTAWTYTLACPRGAEPTAVP